MKFEATTAQPGSEEKIQILEARHAAGFRLWHPGDRSNRTELVGGLLARCEGIASTPTHAAGDGDPMVETDFDDDDFDDSDFGGEA